MVGCKVGTLGRHSANFRFQSPPFKITFVSGNPFGVTAGTGLSVADGQWVCSARWLIVPSD